MKNQYVLQEPQFTVENIDIQSVSRPRGYKHSFVNGRSKHGFIYTVRGKMCDTFHTDEKTMIYSNAGELVFIPKGSIYTGTYLEDDTKIKIVQFDIAKGQLPDYLSSPVKIELPNVGELIDAFFKSVENRTQNHPFYYLSCVYDLLLQIDENCSKIPTKYKKLQPALSEIVDYFRQNRPISYYAGLCDMSEVNFRRLFKEYTGQSPIDYRNELRLKSAKSMLASGEYNVSEAAAISGFSNLSFFIRLYKSKFGHTPKKE